MVIRVGHLCPKRWSHMASKTDQETLASSYGILDPHGDMIWVDAVIMVKFRGVHTLLNLMLKESGYPQKSSHVHIIKMNKIK